MTYSELEKALQEAPMSWCPALIQTLIETAIAKGCFVPGGATRFVNGIENKQPTSLDVLIHEGYRDDI